METIEVVKAKSPEEALALVSENLGIPVEDLAVETEEGKQYSIKIVNRPGTIDLELAPDRMSVTLLSITPPLGSGIPVTAQDIFIELAAMEVVHGIQEDVITGIVEAVMSSREEYNDVTIAMGDPAIDGQDSTIKWLLPEVLEHLSLDSPQKHLVRQGDIIARVAATTLGEPGIMVTGQEYPPKPGESDIPLHGDTIDVSADGHHYIAGKSGYLSIHTEVTAKIPSEVLDIIPPITVAPDLLSATLDLYPPVNLENSPTFEDIMQALKESEVIFGIKNALIPKLCDYLKQNPKPGKNILVAEGRKPVPGEDGRYELQVDITPTAGKIRDDGSIDYRERDFLHTIKTGELLLQRVFPTKGKPGKTVTNQTIKAEDGVDRDAIRAGENVEVSKDGTRYLAMTDGVINCADNKISVTSDLDLQGDVSFKTGNITMEGALNVLGSIQPNFNVTVKGDLSVGEVVEAASLNVEGNIDISSGIIGKDKTVVTALGNLTALYLESAQVHVEGNVTVAQYIRNCRIFCHGDVDVTEKKGKIIGGKIVARNKVKAKEVGTYAGGVTQIYLGYNPANYMKHTEATDQLEIIQEKLTRMRKGTLMSDKLYKKVDELEKTIAELEEDMYPNVENASLEVSGKIHIGTEIYLGPKKVALTEELKGVRIHYSAETDAISWLNL